MNRLILLGNGFDLAHGLKTDYNSFLVWYLKKCFSEAKETASYADGMISIKNNFPYEQINIGEIKNVDQFIDYHYSIGFKALILNGKIEPHGPFQSYNPHFFVKVKSDLLKKLILSCTDKNWVDIENLFYSELKDLLNGKDYADKLNELNNSLGAVLQELKAYLTTIECEDFSPVYSDIFSSTIARENILGPSISNNDTPIYTLILNFNYTPTVEKYLSKSLSLPNPPENISVNYIHGSINDPKNPLIFGFGDELDDDYKRIELKNNNNFFEYIKSFWYFKTSNYHDLIRFIQMDEYEVYTFGHSCGLSDRTLLNMVFENKMCKSIRIFYHGNEHENNHKTLTQEISRHFKDKVSMRSKIVPLDRSSAMPQIQVNK